MQYHSRAVSGDTARVRGTCAHAALARIAYKRRVRRHGTDHPWWQLRREWSASLSDVQESLRELSAAETRARRGAGLSDDVHVPDGQVSWTAPSLLQATSVLDQGPWFLRSAADFAGLARRERSYVVNAVADLVPKLAEALLVDSPRVVGIRSEVPPFLIPPPGTGAPMTRIDWLLERRTEEGLQVDVISVKTSCSAPGDAERRRWVKDVESHRAVVESQMPWSRANGGPCDVVAWVLLAREDADRAEWIAMPSSLRRAS